MQHGTNAVEEFRVTPGRVADGIDLVDYQQAISAIGYACENAHGGCWQSERASQLGRCGRWLQAVNP